LHLLASVKFQFIRLLFFFLKEIHCYSSNSFRAFL